MSWALWLPQSLAFLPLKYSCPNVEKRLDYGFTYSFTRMPNTVLRSKRWTPTVGFTPRFTWTLICSENSTLFPGSGRLAGDFRRSTMMLTALTHSTISGFHFSSYCRWQTKCGSYFNLISRISMYMLCIPPNHTVAHLWCPKALPVELSVVVLWRHVYGIWSNGRNINRETCEKKDFSLK